MRPGPLSTAVAGTVMVVVYAVGSLLLMDIGSPWYRSLVRPGWQPPDAVFGIIWPYNFTALIVAGLVVARQAEPTGRALWLATLAVNVIAALAWARLFSVDHALGAAAVALVTAAVLTIPVVLVAWSARAWTGIILLPYLVWMALAASLAVGYAQLN